MKKTITICIVACVALLAPAAANAATKSYSGSIDPSGKIAFKLKSRNGNLGVIDLAWTNLPVDCGGKSQTSDGTLSFKVPVKNDIFATEALLGPANDPKARAEIRGTLKRRSASGRIELSGSQLPINNGGTDKCESGKLTWSARR